MFLTVLSVDQASMIVHIAFSIPLLEPVLYTHMPATAVRTWYRMLAPVPE